MTDPGVSAQSRLRSLQAFLEHDPGNLKLIADTAAAAIEADEPVEAERLIARYARLSELPPELLNLQGVAALAQDRYEDAAPIFERLLHDAPGDTALRFNLAWCKAAAADYGGAEGLLDEATTSAISAAATLKVQCLHHLGRADDALRIGEPLAARYPLNSELLGKLALAAFDVEDPVTAERLALAAGAQHDALAALGTLRLGADRVSEASAMFDEALSLYPEDARALLGKGLVLLTDNQPEAAVARLDQAAKLFGRHLGSWVASGWTYFALGDRRTSRARFETALSIDDTFAETHGGLAVLDVVEGDLESAQRRVTIALRLDRRCFGAALASSLLLAGRGETAAAQRVRDLALNSAVAPGGRTLAQAIAALSRQRTGS